MSYSFVALDDGFWFGFAFFSGVLKALNDEGITLLLLLEDLDFMLRGIFVMMIMYNSNGELKNTEYFVIVIEIFICIKYEGKIDQQDLMWRNFNSTLPTFATEIEIKSMISSSTQITTWASPPDVDQLK